MTLIRHLFRSTGERAIIDFKKCPMINSLLSVPPICLRRALRLRAHLYLAVPYAPRGVGETTCITALFFLKLCYGGTRCQGRREEQGMADGGKPWR